MSAPATDYSQSLDALWDFDHPAASEARFRAEVARHPAQSREAAEAATQVARAQGLQRKFTDADRTLDGVQRTLDAQPVRVRVRYLLERGRRDNSSQRRAPAVAWFEQALAASANDTLAGRRVLPRRCAAHAGDRVAARTATRLVTSARLPRRQAADDERTRGWRASLLHNLGWTMHDRGDVRSGARLLAPGACRARSGARRAAHPHRALDRRARTALARRARRGRGDAARARRRAAGGERARRLRVRGAGGDRASHAAIARRHSRGPRRRCTARRRCRHEGQRGRTARAAGGACAARHSR